MSTQTPSSTAEQYRIETPLQSNTVGPIDRDLTAFDNALMVVDVLEEYGIEAEIEPAGDSDG